MGLWEGVLSIAKLGRGQEAYYLDSVAAGVEDYYLGAGEAPGRWVGSASSDLELSGTVAADDLRAVLGGSEPGTGRRLVPRNRKLPGFDATFSAPKSVSLIHALGSAEIKSHVVAAHETAVDAAVGYLERQAAFARRGRDGVHRVATSGFVAAAFRHRTSRAGDPHLHTHVLVANLCRGLDGRWGALDGRGLYLHKMDAGAVYQAELRAELTRRLGVEWLAPSKGTAELAGIPPKLLKAFSRRRAEIEAALAERGESSARASEVATLATRRSKERSVDPAALAADWVERAGALGFDASDIDKLVTRRRQVDRPAILRNELGAQLTEHASHFDRRHVIRAIAETARAGANVADLEHVADRFLRSPDVVALTPDDVIGMRYSTEAVLTAERTVLDHHTRGRDAAVGIVDQTAVEREIAARPTLSAEQARMVGTLTTSGAAVDVVVGAAGTGKTFALDACRAAWQTSGHRVVGTALAARTAAQLEAGTGIPSFTIATLLRHLERDRLVRNTVVVVDEAGMVGSRALARLVRAAAATGGKVVLVGDHHQLPEIEAGGVFRVLAREGTAIVLTENRRQRRRNDRRLLADLRAGRISNAVARLRRHGGVITADNADALRQHLVDDWKAAVDNGDNALMLARRRTDVGDLNRRARRAYLDSWDLDPSTEQVVGGLSLCEGDRVVALRNRRSLGVMNGDSGTVTSIGGDAGEVTVRLDRGPTVDLPAGYVADGHLDHGYALTIHKAQGATCDRTFVLGDETLHRETGYTALSRGREENRLYVMGADLDADSPGHHRRISRRETDLVAALRRSEAQITATELGRGIEL